MAHHHRIACAFIDASIDPQMDVVNAFGPQGPVDRCTPEPAMPDSDEILMSVGDVTYEWDIASDAMSWSRNASDVLGFSDLAATASGRGFAELVDPTGGRSRYDAVMARPFEPDDGLGVPYQTQYGVRRPGHSDPLWVEDTGRWFAGTDGRPQRAHGVVRVINERHARDLRLERLSLLDALTGEMNRTRLTDVLQTTIDSAVNLRTPPCGFMLASVDNLARLNEAYGHHVADQVIAAVSKRIRSYLRGRDHLGRFSGNTFGIILHDCTVDDMHIVADRLLVGVRNEIMETEAGAVAATITVGGVSIPRHARTLSEVLTRAQATLDEAKSKRAGSFRAYRPNPEREAQRQRNVDLTRDIIAALNDRRIFLTYEPIVAVGSRKTALYECLMRIRRCDGTMMATNEVMMLAERLGTVRLLDHRVQELVFAELIRAPLLKASMNISATSTVDPDWWSSLSARLRMRPSVGERLTIEITETAAIRDLDETRGFVARAKDLGCRIAMDDFGAGHTSFRNLRKLGVDMVKIDGAFVKNIRRSKDDEVFVHALIDLAQCLGLETVAEWVQDEETASILAGWGCDYIQGALVGLAVADRAWVGSEQDGSHPQPGPEAGLAASA